MILKMEMTNYYHKKTGNHLLEFLVEPENLVQVKQLSKPLIESILVWQITPERVQGTRITERVPFVISSQKWQKVTRILFL